MLLSNNRKITASVDEACSRGEVPRSQYVRQKRDANRSLTVDGDLECDPSENNLTAKVGLPTLARSENTVAVNTSWS